MPVLGEAAPPAAEPSIRLGIRLVGALVLVYLVGQQAHVGGHGEHLSALILLVITTLGWLAWLGGGRWQSTAASVAGLGTIAVAGGALVAFAPLAIAFVGVAAMGASTIVDVQPAAIIALLGVAAAGISVTATGHAEGLFAGAAAAALGGVGTGMGRRQHLLRVEQSAQLAVARERAELERARAAVLEERNRLSRDVHDVLAHSLGALAVQMEALDALLADGGDPARARTAARKSRQLVTGALEQTRTAVRALRDEPVALVEQLAALAASDDASYDVCGQPRPVSPAVALALYRAAQEAIANSRKHATGAAVVIRLEFAASEMTLEVANDARRSAPTPLATSGSGLGLLGMRERVEALGGNVEAGPCSDGWRVLVRVPA